MEIIIGTPQAGQIKCFFFLAKRPKSLYIKITFAPQTSSETPL